MRYVPLEDVSLSEIDKYLLRYPQELCCEITNACNANCRVCIAEAPAKSPIYLSSTDLENAIERLASPVVRITITGGEPTTHPNLISIMARCAATEAKIVLSTNGYEPYIVNRILDLGHVDMVAVSLHGPKDLHDVFTRCPDSYNRAIETIRVVSQQGLPVHVLSIATQETLATLPELSRVLSEFLICEHRISLVKPAGRNLTDIVNYETVLDTLSHINVSYKISIKRRDQPFLLLNCLGNLEVRHEQSY